MTKKSSRQRQTLSAAALQNMAHGSAPAIPLDRNAVRRVEDLLTKLTPANAKLVENIIGVILAEQEAERDEESLLASSTPLKRREAILRRGAFKRRIEAQLEMKIDSRRFKIVL